MNQKFIEKSDGVYAIEKTAKGETNEIWLSSPVRVVRLTRDEDGGNWGKVLNFTDSDGNERETAIPNSMFAGDGREIRERLLDKGLSIASTAKARNLFNDYLNSANPDERATSVNQTGWYKNAFVLPEELIGGTDPIYFQTERPIDFYSEQGTLDEWRDTVSKYCIGNNKLLFAVSLAFAAPLLAPLAVENGGFHIFGPSSCGKSTALRVAASVYGGPDYITTWRATDNGLEGTAAAHNDTLLIMDEMGQVSPNIVGDVVYMLANGEGKSRADRRGNARRTKRWRIAILSSGEIDLDEHLLAAGRQAKAGQEVRLIGIPAVSRNAQYGVFEDIHGLPNGAEFSKYLCQAASSTYGTPFKAYIAKIAPNIDAIRTQWVKFVHDRDWFIPADSDGQVRRAKHRFLLVAFAGELATEYGITGWNTGDAINAAKNCFHEWIENRGGTESREKKRILDQVKKFFDDNAENFVDKERASEYNRYNIAGYRDGAYYMILPQKFAADVISGLNRRTAIKTLIDMEWMYPDKSGRPYRTENINGNTTKVYKFGPKVWEYCGTGE